MQIPYAKPGRANGFCLFFVVGVACVLDLFVARSMSTTYDEPQSVAYGEQILHCRPDRSDPLFNSKTPIAALNAAPRVLAGYSNSGAIPSSLLKALSSIRFARLASVVGTLLLNFYVYRWAYSLYGPVPAIAASILIVFSPNLIAHGTLATNDGYFALGVVMSMFFFRRYLLRPTIKNACLSTFTLATAQLTKPFAAYLYVVVFAVLLLAANDRKNGPPLVNGKNAIAYVSFALISFLLVVNAGFCFKRSLTPLKSYHFDSETFIRLQGLTGAGSVLVPLPYPYLQGLDMLKYDDDSGLTYGKIYLLGEMRDPFDHNFHNFKSYYAVAMLFKEPIAVQILFVCGLLWIWKNRSYREFITGEGVLLSAAALLFIWFSLFRKSQLGIRNILPVVAVEVITAAAAFTEFSKKPRRAQIALGLLVLWACVSIMSYYPNLIPYMNEWVLDRKQSYKILVDSNLDYGQEGDIIREFLVRNPDVVLDPEKPVAGRVLVSVNRLVGEWHGYEPMYWLLRYQPAGRVGYGHLLFVVPAPDLTFRTRN